MLLVTDIGNTEVTLGLFDGGTLRRSFRVSSETRRTPDEVALLLAQAFPEIGPAKGVGTRGAKERRARGTAHHAVIGSVVPAQTTIYAGAVRGLVGTEPLLVNSETTAGVTIEYRDPGSVGADRIA